MLHWGDNTNGSSVAWNLQQVLNTEKNTERTVEEIIEKYLEIRIRRINWTEDA